MEVLRERLRGGELSAMPSFFYSGDAQPIDFIGPLRPFLPADETSGHKNGEVAYTYSNTSRSKSGGI